MSSYIDPFPPTMKDLLQATRLDDTEAIRQWLDDDYRPSNAFFARASAIVAMETVDVARIAPLIGPTTAGHVLDLAVHAKRMDVMQRAMAAVKDPTILLNCNDVLLDDDAIDALLAHIGHDALNSTLTHANEFGVERSGSAWEVWITKDRAIAHERYLDVILPKLHAAGADLMDDRFEEDDAAIVADARGIGSDHTPGRRALATFRRQKLTAQLHAIADAEAPVQPRARKRL